MSFWKGFPLITAEQTAVSSLSPLLEVENLVVHYPVKIPFVQRLFSREKLAVHAVDGVSFTLRPGEILGLVGESGCGKTTVGRAILRLLEPTSGKIKFEGIDVTRAKEARMRSLRRRMQIVFQDPHASLNPAMTIGRAIGHPLRIHGLASNDREVGEAVLRVMREVGLTPEEQLFDKYPGDLSGGQKQRAAIARAIILKPRLIVADEPVAMLDMSIRARVLELMLDLKTKYDLTYVFITHDLATAKFLCDRIAVMYLGRIVEIGPVKQIYEDPKHPYTKALLNAIPIPDPRRRESKILPKGEVPDAVYPPAGCRFHPRCPAVLATCGWEGRDFIDYLEERRLDPARIQQDEKTLGSLHEWWAKGFAAGRKGRPETLQRLVDEVKRVLAEAPSAMVQAVESVRVQNDSVIVQFRRHSQLKQTSIGDRMVECLLYQ